ncbi:MAG: SpoIIE family protein phosphatase [SAR324 cluster bacterium]|nr:SpoIIE family protein phosphatase [SAR324 cluster bacterium]
MNLKTRFSGNFYFLIGVAIISLGLALVPLAYTLFFSYPAFTQILIENTEKEAVRTGSHLKFFLNIEENEMKTITVPEELDRKIREEINKFQLVKVKVFLNSGKTIYSTDSDDVGKINEENYFHEIVAKGNVYTKVVEKDTLSLEGEKVTVDVVETYVPILDQGRFKGAFEIYYEITEAKEKLEDLVFNSTVVLFTIAFSFLFVITVVVVLLTKNIAKRAEMARLLHESEMKFRSVAQSAVDAVISANSHGLITHWNKSARVIFNYSENEVLGKPITILMPEQQREIYHNGIKRYLETGDSHVIGRTVELQGLKKGNIIFPIEISISSWKIADEVFFSAIVRDISERKEVEEKLEKSYLMIKDQQRQLDLELEHARETQRFLFPKTIPSRPKITIAHKYIPMEKVGGDFYDVFNLKKEKLGLMIGDVTGHGISAALISFMVANSFKQYAYALDSTEMVINFTNGNLENKLPLGTFATMFYAIFDPATQSLLYTNAGQPPGLVIRPQTQEILNFNSDGPPIGVFSNQVTNYKETLFQLMPGDKFLLYTDALFEVVNSKKERLGIGNFESFLQKHYSTPIDELLENIYDFGMEFSEQEGFDDDVTMLGFEILRK